MGVGSGYSPGLPGNEYFVRDLPDIGCFGLDLPDVGYFGLDLPDGFGYDPFLYCDISGPYLVQ